MSGSETESFTTLNAVRTPARSLLEASRTLSRIRALRPSRNPAGMSPRDSRLRSDPGKP
ncbi:hypothetical protein SAMN05661080_01211 [Modestobacter sp. DSM 44400]|nr:hypothetical protein SAMN05661080_01211 [Modestobacter sp. DSM 44400]